MGCGRSDGEHRRVHRGPLGRRPFRIPRKPAGRCAGIQRGLRYRPAAGAEFRHRSLCQKRRGNRLPGQSDQDHDLPRRPQIRGRRAGYHEGHGQRDRRGGHRGCGRHRAPEGGRDHVSAQLPVLSDGRVLQRGCERDRRGRGRQRPGFREHDERDRKVAGLHGNAFYQSARPARFQPLHHGPRYEHHHPSGADLRDLPRDHLHGGVYRPGDESQRRKAADHDQLSDPGGRQPLSLRR